MLTVLAKDLRPSLRLLMVQRLHIKAGAEAALSTTTITRWPAICEMAERATEIRHVRSASR